MTKREQLGEPVITFYNATLAMFLVDKTFLNTAYNFFSLQVILSSSAPAADFISTFRSNMGVSLSSRKKAQDNGEKCPTETVSYCKCRAKSEGLDITCENVNSEQLNVSIVIEYTNKAFSIFFIMQSCSFAELC